MLFLSVTPMMIFTCPYKVAFTCHSIVDFYLSFQSCSYVSFLCSFLPVRCGFYLFFQYWFLPVVHKLFLSVLPMLIFTCPFYVGSICPTFVDFYFSFLSCFSLSLQCWFLPVLPRSFLSIPNMLIFTRPSKVVFTCPSNVDFYIPFKSCFYLSFLCSFLLVLPKLFFRITPTLIFTCL